MSYKTVQPHRKSCFLCGVKGEPVTCCENWERILKFLKARYGRQYWRKPERTFMCKDFCIDPLDGHRCLGGIFAGDAIEQFLLGTARALAGLADTTIPGRIFMGLVIATAMACFA